MLAGCAGSDPLSYPAITYTSATKHHMVAYTNIVNSTSSPKSLTEDTVTDLGGSIGLSEPPRTSDILVLKIILVLVFILFSSQNFYFLQFFFGFLNQ